MSPEFPKCTGSSLHLCIKSHLLQKKKNKKTLKGCHLPIQTQSKPSESESGSVFVTP